MKHLLAPTAIIAAVALLLSSVAPAAACTCRQVSTTERVAQTELIIIGQAVSNTVVLRESDERAQYVALIDVDRYLKGSGTGALAVHFGLGSTCDYYDLYVPGDDFVLFLQRTETGTPSEYITHFCAGNVNLDTRSAFISADVEDYLLDIERITGPGELPNTTDLPREAFWALAILLPVAFLASATLVAARRK